MAIDLGLPGLIAFLAIVGLAVYLAARSYVAAIRARRADWVFMSAACLASLGGMCVHGVFDATSWGNKGAFVPWLVMGIAVALYRRQSRCAGLEECVAKKAADVGAHRDLPGKAWCAPTKRKQLS